jgi:hypothetical protein
MRIRENLGGLVATQGKRTSIPSPKPAIGKVFGVITTENTPTKALFESNGGWKGIGTVFYLDYENSKNVNNVDLNGCKIAKPFHSNIQKYPLIGELIHLIEAPSPVSQISNTSTQKYYTGTVNIWNNNQQNAPSGDSLGKTFIENNDIRNLINFEGDTIYQGRKGNGIRFGSTVKQQSNINEWSSIGNDGDPITIMVNGYVTTDTGSLSPNVEEINKEQSSIYLTSTQKLPLQPGASIVNPRVNTIAPKDYISSQLIFNSDRITLNSKKDEVLLFAKTNIELNSDNIININAGQVAHINSPSIALGTNSDGSYPTEPVLLGGKTHDLLLDILGALSNLAGFLSSATVATPEGAIPITDCNLGGEQLFADISNLIDKLDTITSDKVYTV